jgi:GrpB-like predicted nucleotidyltransferase (UPF0157 family)/GNAT superfamily N-acetyltransferase
MKKDEYRKIEVVPYNPQWADSFAHEAELLKNLMGDLIVKIHHVGSTSIPGIKAKPIIDMIPEVRDINKVDTFNSKLSALGYVSYGEYGLVGRRFFVKSSSGGERLVNAHFYPTNHPEIEQNILFRDYLKSNPQEGRQYSELKEKLATKFPHDIESYVNGKDVFVKNIIAKTGFDRLFLREVRTDNEWLHYHRIRKTELFENYVQDVEYDPNHPTLTNPNTKHYVFYKGADIIGTIFTEKLDKKRVAFRLLAIDKDLKNKGYGSALIKQIEDVVRNEGYKTILLHANAPAYNFYKRNGYVEMEFNEPALVSNCIDMGKLL